VKATDAAWAVATFQIWFVNQLSDRSFKVIKMMTPLKPLPHCCFVFLGEVTLRRAVAELFRV